MKNRIHQALQLGALGVLLACVACEQDDAEASPANADDPGKVAEPMSENDNNEASSSDDLSQKVSAAVADLSKRTGIAADAITVTTASLVNWGSSAVGCPREDMNYMQVIVPGILVLLEVGGKTYRYHGSENGELFHCPDDRATAPAYGSGQEFM